MQKQQQEVMKGRIQAEDEGTILGCKTNLLVESSVGNSESPRLGQT